MVDNEPRILSAGSTTTYGGIVNEMFDPTVVTSQPTTSNGSALNGQLPKKFDVDPLIIGMFSRFQLVGVF